MAAVYSDVLQMIGNTRMLELERFDTGLCTLLLKLECDNPSGSIKDRTALAMIEAAEQDGSLSPGDTLVEATAGNTGLGLALVASAKGYRLLLVIPDKMSEEKIAHLRAMGTEVRLTRSDVHKGHPDHYQELAERLAAERRGFYVNQFANPANPLAHEQGTGPEIWEQAEQRVDAVVVGVGSGGTATGLGRFFARVSPQTEIVLADPEGSILAPLKQTGEAGRLGSWLVEGIGEDFVPPNLDLSLVDRAYSIPDEESFAAAWSLLAREGILAGSSTGTLLAAALRYCREQTTAKRVVTLACDTGNKYLSKMYSEHWMTEHGFAIGGDRDDRGGGI
ncbi:MAG: PLP-dependent cysteine synthase family protein [Deltaproteobacteria bacterium]|nr:PLP-dependent cysteine synthase family protein [Deltaproteobacteria bacterium]